MSTGGTQWWRAPAWQMARAVKQGEVSALQLTEAALARMDATDGRVNAFTDRTAERALQRARALDACSPAERAGLPLAGVPFAVKNLFDIAGLPTRAGSKIERGSPPKERDAELVRRMETAGAVLVGALNMDEYAYGFTTENSHDGPVHNPHDLSRISGGSSGGSGAAVAAGQVPITLGSDTNGSIRVPASLCGVFGLKPTFGRLPRTGSYPFVCSLDHLGPLARSARDLALAYDAMQGPDAHDPSCAGREPEPVVSQLEAGSAGLRMAVLGGYFDDFAGAQAREAVARVAQALGVSRRIELPEVALARAAAFLVTNAEGAALHLPDLRRRAADFEPLSRDRFLAGALLPAAWVHRAQRFRHWYARQMAEVFRDVDVLIAPATPLCASPIGSQTLEINGQTHPARPSVGLLTQPISCIGLPVCAVPVWPSQAAGSAGRGLPIGVQIIAAPWREDRVLQVAWQLEAAGMVSAPVAELA